jgi:hypothetical protein
MQLGSLFVSRSAATSHESPATRHQHELAADTPQLAARRYSVTTGTTNNQFE